MSNFLLCIFMDGIMKVFKVKTVLFVLMVLLPGACRYNDDLWRRASDKIDDVAPTVSYFDPGAGSTDGGITVALSIRFDDDMMHSTLNSSTITIEETGFGLISGSWSYDLVDVTGGQQSIARFTPTGGVFKRGTDYTLTVSTGARDYYGNYLASEYSAGFTTASDFDLDSSSIDTITNPANHTITLVFNDPPANGWQVNVAGTYSGGTVFNTNYGSAASGVTWSASSRSIVIATGETFDSGVGAVTLTLSSFSAETDGNPYAGSASISLDVP